MVDYCTLEQIKQRVDIDTSETEFDTELESIRDEVEAEIDNYLKNHTATPLTGSIPEVVSTVCADLCGVDFRLPRAPSADAATHLKVLREVALAKLQSYIEQTYGAGQEIAFTVATDET